MAMRQSAQLHIQSVLYKLLRRYLEHWQKAYDKFQSLGVDEKNQMQSPHHPLLHKAWNNS